MNEVNVPYKLMIVDDSKVVQKFYESIFVNNKNIDVVGFACNGVDALRKITNYNPEIVLLDLEMPEMDGITVLPKLLELMSDLIVIVVSSHSKKNASATIKALALGAADCIEKPSSLQNNMDFEEGLVKKLSELGEAKRSSNKEESTILSTDNKIEPILDNKIKAVAIGSSTGGPQALIKLFDLLGDSLNLVPVFLTQHLPGSFTNYFIEQLAKVTKLKCVVGKDNLAVSPGYLYVAPGDYHMRVKKIGPSKVVIKLSQEGQINFCRPAVDPLFESVAEVYGKNVLSIVLTGMGKDGLDGAREIKKKGGIVLIQDEESSVVWGMPGSIANEGLQDAALNIDNMVSYIKKTMGNDK